MRDVVYTRARLVCMCVRHSVHDIHLYNDTGVWINDIINDLLMI